MLAPRPDLVLADTYRFLREIGRGAMGSVWEAEHLAAGRRVAVKLVSQAIATAPGGLERFLREARIIGTLSSPHIVQLVDIGAQSGTPFMVMELLRGESLEALLHRVKRLSFKQVEVTIRHIGRALKAAHDAGVVHRDLKPANIFVVDGEGSKIVKLLDFGVAKPLSHLFNSAPKSMTQTGALVGTPLYASPEQVEGLKTIDHRSDVWALGVVAFECLLGWPPFSEETLGGVVLAICSRPLPVPSEWGPVPPGFDKWFTRTCHRDPAQRYPSAEQAAQLLCTILRDVRGDWPWTGAADTVAFAEPKPALTPPEPPSSSLQPQAQRVAPRGEEQPPPVFRAAHEKWRALSVPASVWSGWTSWRRSSVHRPSSPNRRNLIAATIVLVLALGALSALLAQRSPVEPDRKVSSLAPARQPPGPHEAVAPSPRTVPEDLEQPATGDEPEHPAASPSRPPGKDSRLAGLRADAPPPSAGRSENHGSGGGLDASAIAQTVRRYSPQLRQSCWQRHLNARTPSAPSSAKISATITVAPAGHVRAVTMSDEPKSHAGLSHCIEDSIRSWRFPLSDGQTVTNVPFLFVGE